MASITEMLSPDPLPHHYDGHHDDLQANDYCQRPQRNTDAGFGKTVKVADGLRHFDALFGVNKAYHHNPIASNSYATACC